MTRAWKNATRVVSVGECMVELARGPDGRFGLSYGGDTFNTSVYLSRAGCSVAYATALGDDPYSAGIAEMAEREAVATDLMVTLRGRMPGLYLIETAQGERTFWYWRDRAAARDLFECEHSERVATELAAAGLIYFSGVTLSLYSERGLDTFAAALSRAKAAGARIAMDSNYRPRGWGGDIARAQRTFERFWRLADVALPTFEDEQALWGDATPAAVAARMRGLGVPEVVVKSGPDGAYVASGGEEHEVPCPAVQDPVDTTAAGDSFNAGYIAARRLGATEVEAADSAHRLAAVVIQHRGAIVPKDATDTVVDRRKPD